MDHERGAALRALLRRGHDINLFVLDWGGRRIPFWGEVIYGREPASDTEIIRWKVLRIGVGHKLSGAPEQTVATYHFASSVEREAANALILGALRAYLLSFPHAKPRIVEVSLGEDGELTL